MNGNNSKARARVWQWPQYRKKWNVGCILGAKCIEGLIIRSRARWHEIGEKTSSYFLNLEKRHFTPQLMKQLINDRGDTVVGSQAILQSFPIFIHHSAPPSKSQTPMTSISATKTYSFQKIKYLCYKDLTLNEIRNALLQMTNGKIPDSDGITTEFYNLFWPNIKHFVLSVSTDSFLKGSLSGFQVQGVITCIPREGKYGNHIANWRPVTWLNTDYKIHTLPLANRLKRNLTWNHQFESNWFSEG